MRERAGSVGERFPFWQLRLTVLVGVLVILVGADRTLAATDNLSLTYAYIAASTALVAGAATYVKRRTEARVRAAQRGQHPG